LKKRSKKLLTLWALARTVAKPNAVVVRPLDVAKSRVESKSFLLLFFKKEALSSLLCTRLTMKHHLKIWREGRAGRIRLQRPEALNALDLGMVRGIFTALAEFGADPTVHLVLVDAPERGFCAGGDVRAARSAVLAGHVAGVEAFFEAEYAMNRAIAELGKPYVALVDGVCMGGGVGVSVHGSHRIATERAVFAMPETAIALFPDVGMSFVLPRMPGSLGMYCGLTGARMAGADAVHAGFATHFVPSARLPALAEAVVRDGVAAIAGFCAAPLPGFTLADARGVIDAAFGADSVAEILRRLEAEGGVFAQATLAQLRAHSPSAVHWSYRIIREGAGRNLAQALAAELALVRHVAVHPEFLEGVRAMLVDKDRAPKWRPGRLEEVDPAVIAALFAATPP
jgi:enoyl-CoA hydratase